MKFQEHLQLNEVRRTQNMQVDDIIEKTRKNCGKAINAYKAGYVIYRGLTNNSGFAYVNPKNFTRTSANTSNLYTLIIDNHPKWKQYPKRSKSIICASNSSNASSYGNVFVVFPKDGSNYGVCPVGDIWSSFEKTLGPNYWLSDINDQVDDLFKEFGIGYLLKSNSYKDLVKRFERLDNELMNINWVRRKWYSWADGYKGDFLRLLQNLLVPGPNGFYQTKDPMKLPPSGTNHEVWTDGESYLFDEIWMRSNASKLWERFSD